MIKSIAKKVILVLYPFFYLKHFFFSKKTVRILIFHDVPRTAIANFEILISSLQEDFDFLTPVEFRLYLAGEYLLKRQSILITFDDGFMSSKQAADIVLKKFGIKAIFFLCPDIISLGTKDGEEMVVKYILGGVPASMDILPVELPMNKEDLIDLIEDGHTIGSHSSRHQRLSNLTSDKDLKYAIGESKRKIKQLLQVNAEDFAYPFGDIGSIHQQAFHEIKKDFKYCFSGVRGCNNFHENPYALKREPINLFDNLYYNRLICYGGLSWFYRMKRSRLEGMAR